MLRGLMQDDYPLTLQLVLDRVRRRYAGSEVVSARDGDVRRAQYGEVAQRVDRLCRALESLGVEQGDRVATFAWNSQEHLEAYLAAPSMGAVLHTLNIRLFEDQLKYVVNHAQDKVILVDASLVPVLEKVVDGFEEQPTYVVIGEGDHGSLPDARDYEELLAEQDDGFDYPELDERMAAGLCYTSGTTGNPKGVLYSHRSNVLHAMGQTMADSMGISSDDRALPIVPMFHANAWGIPYGACLSGADLVMPGPQLDAESLSKLIADERVTFSAAVPTIWMDMLRHADENDVDLSSLRLVVCGGSAVPLSLMQAFEERHDVRIIQAWGMTETSPLGSVARPPGDASEDEHWEMRNTAGRVSPLVDARIIDDDGNELPFDGEATGELQVRGPWVAAEYYEDPAGPEKFDGEWLRTGDIAAIDEQGFIRISDRTKDVIKSGGEWISSVELEGEIMAHPAVLEAAVIAKPDEKWSERPLACVVLDEGASLTSEELREHLEARVAKWWLPDEVVVIAEVPKTSVGKFDKKLLRQRLEEGELESEELASA
jgi:acyl-CoA synthetase (AMP-forming)/AMP-acid ligase II